MQTNNSHFKKLITQKQLKLILHRVFPNNTLVENFTQIKSGRFNITYKLEIKGIDPVILCIAPNPALKVYIHEHHLLRREYAVHPFLSSIAKHVPRIFIADFTRELIDRDYTIQSFIEGINWDQSAHELLSQQKIDLWNQLSDISELINQEGVGFGLPDPCSQFTSWSTALANILIYMIRDLEKYFLKTSSPKKLLNLIYEHKKYLNEISKSMLTHGDLWPKNILIKKDNRVKIVGVLDSERAFWGDPRAEWIITGTRFAGQKSNDGYVFRCGLFSADYTEIPASTSERYECKDVGEFFRKQIYLGIYLTQRRLESQRFPRNEQWIEEEFNNVFTNLKNVSA